MIQEHRVEVLGLLYGADCRTPSFQRAFKDKINTQQLHKYYNHSFVEIHIIRMGRRQSHIESPSPAPGLEAAVVKPAPQAPIQVLYCAGTLLSSI